MKLVIVTLLSVIATTLALNVIPVRTGLSIPLSFSLSILHVSFCSAYALPRSYSSQNGRFEAKVRRQNVDSDTDAQDDNADNSSEDNTTDENNGNNVDNNDNTNGNGNGNANGDTTKTGDKAHHHHHHKGDKNDKNNKDDGKDTKTGNNSNNQDGTANTNTSSNNNGNDNKGNDKNGAANTDQGTGKADGKDGNTQTGTGTGKLPPGFPPAVPNAGFVAGADSSSNNNRATVTVPASSTPSAKGSDTGDNGSSSEAGTGKLPQGFPPPPPTSVGFVAGGEIGNHPKSAFEEAVNARKEYVQKREALHVKIPMSNYNV